MGHLSRKLFSTTVLFLLYLNIPGSWAQITLRTLQDQVDILNLASQSYQQQITLINSQLAAQAQKESRDIANLQNALANTIANVDSVQAQANANSGAISTLAGQVGALGNDLSIALQRIERLEGVNKIWKSNFQIVNRTFVELRRRFKFVVPVMRLPAVYVLPVNTRNG